MGQIYQIPTGMHTRFLHIAVAEGEMALPVRASLGGKAALSLPEQLRQSSGSMRLAAGGRPSAQGSALAGELLLPSAGEVRAMHAVVCYAAQQCAALWCGVLCYAALCCAVLQFDALCHALKQGCVLSPHDLRSCPAACCAE